MRSLQEVAKSWKYERTILRGTIHLWKYMSFKDAATQSAKNSGSLKDGQNFLMSRDAKSAQKIDNAIMLKTYAIKLKFMISFYFLF